MSDDARHSCDTCHVSFHRKTDYNRHLRTAKHGKLMQGIPSYKCDNCAFTTANTYEWNRHLNTAKHKRRSTLVDSGKDDYVTIISKLIDENRDMRVFITDELQKLMNVIGK
jgi:hypothetical protein